MREALSYVTERGWTVEPKASGHGWGFARCGNGCLLVIWSTPKNPGNHAKQIRRAVDRGPHEPESKSDA